MLVIEHVLQPAQTEALCAALEAADWQDGRNTAGWQAMGVKHNAQLPENTPMARELADQVVGALERSKLFIAAALPARVYPPMFNRYEPGQDFGPHVDTAIRQVAEGPRIRADLSATLFLSDPASYEGGELVVQDGGGARAAKLPAGSLVLYNGGTVHQVAPVTSGVRLAAVMWIQSMVRSAADRDLLYDLDSSIQHLAVATPDHAALVQLTGVYHNLLRRWAEC